MLRVYGGYKGTRYRSLHLNWYEHAGKYYIFFRKLTTKCILEDWSHRSHYKWQSRFIGRTSRGQSTILQALDRQDS